MAATLPLRRACVTMASRRSVGRGVVGVVGEPGHLAGLAAQAPRPTGRRGPTVSTSSALGVDRPPGALGQLVLQLARAPTRPSRRRAGPRPRAARRPGGCVEVDACPRCRPPSRSRPAPGAAAAPADHGVVPDRAADEHHAGRPPCAGPLARPPRPTGVSVGRLTTTPNAPSGPWASSRTTVRSKLGSPISGVATRSRPTWLTRSPPGAGGTRGVRRLLHASTPRDAARAVRATASGQAWPSSPAADGAGGQAEELAQHGRGGAPDGVAVPARRRTSTARSPNRSQRSSRKTSGSSSSAERHVEHRLDLGRVGHQRGAAGQDAHVRDDERVAGDGAQVVELADDLHRGRVEPTSSCASRRAVSASVLAVLLATAREAHLAAVHAQRRPTVG